MPRLARTFFFHHKDNLNNQQYFMLKLLQLMMLVSGAIQVIFIPAHISGLAQMLSKSICDNSTGNKKWFKTLLLKSLSLHNQQIFFCSAFGSHCKNVKRKWCVFLGYAKKKSLKLSKSPACAQFEINLERAVQFILIKPVLILLI